MSPSPETVLVTHPVPAGSLDVLSGYDVISLPGEEPVPAEVLAEAAREVSAVLCSLIDRLDEGFFAAANNLRVVGSISVGYDHIDLPAAERHRVTVCHTPGVLDEATADLAFALILGAARLLGSASEDLMNGRWRGWGMNQYLGQEVHGATLGLVGYGRIARAVERRAEGFDMHVIHHTRHDTGLASWRADLDTLLAESDIVSLHVPLTDATRHLMDARSLARMRPSAVLVNTARGPVVDEDALATALEEDRLFAAGFDVYEHEPEVNPRLLSHPRALCLPHIGSATTATRTAMAEMAARDVVAVLAGKKPAHPVPGSVPI